MQCTVEYKNSKISYYVSGSGEEVLILLHGFLENSLMWKEIVDDFSEDIRIICVDLLGHGSSESLGYVHSMEDMASAVYEVIMAENIKKATLVGHSMGGYVALAFAEKYPEIMHKLCLLNSTSQADSDERKQLRTRAIEMAKRNYEALVSMSVVNLFASKGRNQIKEAIEACKNEALKTPLQAYIACSEGMKKRANREHVLTLGSFKKVIIAGEKDPVLNYTSIVAEGKRTNTKVVSLPSGHMSHIESSVDLKTILAEFLVS